MNRRDAILKIKQILVRRRDSLRSDLANNLNLLQELRAQNPFNSDSDDVTSQLAESESRELGRIEHALERMRQGNFGVCENCGAKISMTRINALPYAVSCIKCQRRSEYQSENTAFEVDWSRLTDSTGREMEMSVDDIS